MRKRTIRSGAGQFGVDRFSGFVSVLLGLGIGTTRALEKHYAESIPCIPLPTGWNCRFDVGVRFAGPGRAGGASEAMGAGRRCAHREDRCDGGRRGSPLGLP